MLKDIDFVRISEKLKIFYEVDKILFDFSEYQKSNYVIVHKLKLRDGKRTFMQMSSYTYDDLKRLTESKE